jgi:hypothetical protein
MARLVITCRPYGKIAIGATLSLEEVPAEVRNPPRADSQRGYQTSDFIH